MKKNGIGIGFSKKLNNLFSNIPEVSLLDYHAFTPLENDLNKIY